MHMCCELYGLYVYYVCVHMYLVYICVLGIGVYHMLNVCWVLSMCVGICMCCILGFWVFWSCVGCAVLCVCVGYWAFGYLLLYVGCMCVY